MRSAESRLGIIESLSSARLGAERTVSRLSAPVTYTKAGLIAGSGLLGMWTLRRMFRRSKPTMAVAPAANEAAGGFSVRYLLVQSLTLLLFPWLRARLLGGEWDGAFRRFQPAHIFFRWLGLEK